MKLYKYLPVTGALGKRKKRFRYEDRRVYCTVAGTLGKWKKRFRHADIPEPVQSAELIVAHALGKKMIQEVDFSHSLQVGETAKIDKLCEKRLTRCPVQYVIGEWDFHDMTLDMRQPVLIPRTETEELAEYIVNHQRQGTNTGPSRVLDIGCGSGALSLYLLKQLPQYTCVSVDISEVACQLTYQNACKYSLQDRLQIIHGDCKNSSIMTQIEEQGPYDVIVSNPPYIQTADMERLNVQVYRFEDHTALHGGLDGLDMIRYILLVTRKLLKRNTGTLWLEVDLSHPKQIETIISTQLSESLEYASTLKDYTNRDRFCVIRGRSLVSLG